jgi:hypothetical protein
MATKKTESKQETLFTKEQILASNKYADKKDVCNTMIPNNFHGTLSEVDVLIENFMKGKVK